MVTRTVGDQSPIDQAWIHEHCRQMTRIADMMPKGVMQDAIRRQVDIIEELVAQWQTRHLLAAEHRDADKARLIGEILDADAEPVYCVGCGQIVGPSGCGCDPS